jgi:two-component system, OmpR family, response regulator RstA
MPNQINAIGANKESYNRMVDNMSQSSRILLVEDDVKLAGLIKEFLDNQGFDVAIESKGDKAVDRILAENPDAAILDIMLPGLDGLSICTQVRPQYSKPILILTARGGESDELAGFENGADDYLAKPVRPQILLARLKTLLKRFQYHEDTCRLLKCGNLTIDVIGRRVHVDGKTLDLTTSEYQLLYLFVQNAGSVLTRDQISMAMHGYEWDGLDRSVDLGISRLRKKLGDDVKNPQWIKSVRSQGYLLAENK